MPKNIFNIVCRGSWLSLAQTEIFRRKVHAKHPGIELTVTIKETAGDKEQSTPLHLVEGKDFFTKEIQDHLRSGEADFAIHSMKDVSGDHFFKGSHYALIERDDPRDVVIFNSEVITKIQHGKKIVVGTSSPRRELMATEFLQVALPRYNDNTINIAALPVRGNVDTRLQKLSDKKFDGIILAAAGLNRLLRYNASTEKVRGLLEDKILMVLPLFECPPAPGQGAIVAEATIENTDAIEILKSINDKDLKDAIKKERVFAHQYGGGCFQEFGAIHVKTEHLTFTYASGKDRSGVPFTETQFDVRLEAARKQVFSSAGFMKDFFNYEFMNEEWIGQTEAVFIASHKAVHSTMEAKIKGKRVWAAGTKTWMELAKKGIWVEGCADGLGLEFLLPLLKSPLVDLDKHRIMILTNEDSKREWQAEGWLASSTYRLIPAFNKNLISVISKADIIFWTSFQQYIFYKNFLKENVEHCCPSGKTAKLFLEQGIQPVVFPGIKAFNEWKTKHILLPAGE